GGRGRGGGGGRPAGARHPLPRVPKGVKVAACPPYTGVSAATFTISPSRRCGHRWQDFKASRQLEAARPVLTWSSGDPPRGEERTSTDHPRSISAPTAPGYYSTPATSGRSAQRSDAGVTTQLVTNSRNSLRT